MTERDDIKGRIKAADARKRAHPGIFEQETMPEHDGPPPVRIQPPPIPLDDTGLDHEDGEMPTNVRPSAKSAGAVPASEEALRVFDEMSGCRTFPGEHSGMQTDPPRHGDRIVSGRSKADRSAMEAETAAFGPEEGGSGPLLTPPGGAVG